MKSPGESVPVVSTTPKSKEFKDKIELILGQQIDVGNIDDYIQKAVDGLIAITEEILEEYKTEHPEDLSAGKELEDHAYRAFELTDIEQYLVVGDQKLGELKEIDSFIKNKVKKLATVITPPDKSMPRDLGSIKTQPELASIKPRLKTLLYLLQENGVGLDEVSCFDGIINSEMVRQTSYVSVVVPSLDRLILVCDEEGNASYVFDLNKLAEENLEMDAINNMTKSERNELIARVPEIGRRIVYSEESWKNRMEEIISKELTPERSKPSGTDVTKKEWADKNLPLVSTWELDPWKGFWTDPETGKHWGSPEKIAGKIKLERTSLRREINNAPLEKKTVFINPSSILRPAEMYSLEDVSKLPWVIKRLEEIKLPKVEESGEWKGFWEDPETGKHWGSIRSIAPRINLDEILTRKIVRESDLKPKRILDIVGRANTGMYSMEEVEQLSGIKQKNMESRLPRVDSTGEWEGFWFDPATNVHWGSVRSIARKTGLGGELVKKNVRHEPGLETKTVLVKTSNGFRPALLHSLESIVKLPWMIERIEETKLPRVEESGEWKGFWEDPETGKHWGGHRNCQSKNRKKF